MLIAAMLARDNPEDAVILLYEHQRVGCLYSTKVLIEWYQTKHSNWKQGILKHLVSEAVSAHEQGAVRGKTSQSSP